MDREIKVVKYGWLHSRGHAQMYASAQYNCCRTNSYWETNLNMARLCESNIIFPCVHLPVGRNEYILVCFKIMDTSVYFNEIYSVDTQADWFACPKLCTKYPCESYFRHTMVLSMQGDTEVYIRQNVHSTSLHLSVKLSPPKPLGGLQPNLLHHFPSWLGCARATLFFRPSGYLLNHCAEFNQTFYVWPPLMIRVWESKSIRHAISNISKERGDLQWHAIDCALYFPVIWPCDLNLDPKWPSFEWSRLMGANILSKFSLSFINAGN